MPEKHVLTLSPGMRAVPLRKPPASSLKLWNLAEATVQEETRAAERKPLLKRIRKEDSGSQLSVDDIRYKSVTWGEEQTPPGMAAPDITAPDGGTTRGRPAGIAVAMRSVSLITAVCSIIRANSALTNECAYQERKFLKLFVAWRLVEDRPYSTHLVD